VKNKKVKSKKNKDRKTLENGIAKIRTKNFRLKSLKLICIISVIEFLFVILQANSIGCLKPRQQESEKEKTT
jgi:hypothetical protein